MEAPDRIYFDGNDRACKLPIFSSTNIEYIRTDAFIDKACVWLNKNTGFFSEKELIQKSNERRVRYEKYNKRIY